MRVRALTAVAAQGERLVAATPVGEIEGKWCGQGAVAAGDVLHVELELPRPRESSEILWLHAEGPTGQMNHPGRWLEGVAVDVDQEGVLTLDVGGTPVLVDTAGDPPLGVVGQRVRLLAEDMEFHPVGL